MAGPKRPAQPRAAPRDEAVVRAIAAAAAKGTRLRISDEQVSKTVPVDGERPIGHGTVVIA